MHLPSSLAFLTPPAKVSATELFVSIQIADFGSMVNRKRQIKELARKRRESGAERADGPPVVSEDASSGCDDDGSLGAASCCSRVVAHWGMYTYRHFLGIYPYRLSRLSRHISRDISQYIIRA